MPHRSTNQRRLTVHKLCFFFTVVICIRRMRLGLGERALLNFSPAPNWLLKQPKPPGSSRRKMTTRSRRIQPSPSGTTVSTPNISYSTRGGSRSSFWSGRRSRFDRAAHQCNITWPGYLLVLLCWASFHLEALVTGSIKS
jgi:hypothetical protein